MKLVLATRNQDKVNEMRHLFDTLPVDIRTVADFPDAPEVDEDQPTLEGNALKKARVLYEHTGLPSASDDTGLEVEALDGRPGVWAARYAGENATYQDNVRKLLGEMQGKSHRTAHFRTVIAYVNGKEEHLFEGICSGKIQHEQHGEGGFGYDPIFLPDGFETTFAEMTIVEKHPISHRGKALEKLHTFLQDKMVK